MKKKENAELTAEELIESYTKKGGLITKRKMLLGCVSLFVIGLLVFTIHSMGRIQTLAFDTEDGFVLAVSPMAATSSKKEVIAIPSGVVKANPFLPYRTIKSEADGLVMDVPKYDLISPPDLNENGEETAKILETSVSGILFDKYSPSAILKIDGEDYLVKKGDTVHNYKIINIARNSVTVQNGKNTFQAGIGELLSEDTVHYNDVSNLNKKFGGEQR